MFCGELLGDLVLSHHLSFRAGEVRDSIVDNLYPNPEGLRDGARLASRQTRWQQAKKEGWRVVPVIVEKRNEWLRHRANEVC